jgi:hypothetical protein
LTAVHPVVRTNPVTGWKSIYSIGGFPKWDFVHFCHIVWDSLNKGQVYQRIASGRVDGAIEEVLQHNSRESWSDC